MSDYSGFSEKTIILHKLASNYGWTYKDIFGPPEDCPCPYPTVKEIVKLLDMLEKDQAAFLSPIEAAEYKNLLRQHPPKDEKD